VGGFEGRLRPSRELDFGRLSGKQQGHHVSSLDGDGFGQNEIGPSDWIGREPNRDRTGGHDEGKNTQVGEAIPRRDAEPDALRSVYHINRHVVKGAVVHPDNCARRIGGG